MKGGLLSGMYAIAALRSAFGGLPLGRLIYVANPDEEIGSPTSTPHILSLAPSADVALVLECARANGDIVSSRKGIMSLTVTIHGRAAHAGVEPEKGRSAILEAARIVGELHALNGRSPGVTFNVGVIRGGTRPNVVAERCELEVDVRAVTREGLVGADASLREVLARTSVPDVTVELAVTHRWWPMEKLDRSGRLVDHAVELASRLGFELRTPRRAARPMGTRRPASGCRRSTGWGPSAGSTTRRRVPGGLLDRAADHAARRTPRVDRTGSRDRGLAAGAARGRSGGCDGRRRRRSGGRLTARRSGQVR